MQRVLAVLGWLGLLCACACDSSPGAMGQAHFSTDCAPTDQACMAAGLYAPIAKGGRVSLDVGVNYSGTAALALVLQSVDPAVLQASGNELTGIEEGVVALLVQAPGQRVIDFIHVSVKAPSRLGIHRLGSESGDLGELSPNVQLLTGDQISVDVRPYDDDSLLLGALDATWSASGDAVTMINPGLGSRRQLVARTPGSARLTVTSGAMNGHIDLEVLP